MSLKPQDRPNILLLFSDQLRRDALGIYGNPIVQTPNIDALARQGMVFNRAYTPSPVCMSARHCLVTGHRPKVHGYWSNNEIAMDCRIPTLPRLLRDNGMIAQAIGKMHFMPPRAHHGFDRMLLMEETPATREEDDYLLYLKTQGLGHICHQHGVRHVLYHQPQRALVPEEHTGNHWVADRSIEFLQANAGRGFFLWSSWIAPHPPFNTVKRWAEFYDAGDMPLPATDPDEVVGSHAKAMHFLADVDGGTPQRRERRIRRMKACYYAQVSHVDEQVGRILNSLEELGLAENTLVIFTADHGEMLGDHGSWQKSTHYEGAWGIPMIVRWPKRIPAGGRSDAFVSLLDVLPTCLGAAGIAYPSFDVPPPGASLLDADAIGRRDAVFAEEGRGDARWLAVRTDRFKLAWHIKDATWEFYDLAADPGEFRDLIVKGMNPEQAKAFQDLQRRLVEYERTNGFDPLPADPFRCGQANHHWMSHNRQLPSWPPNLIDPGEKAAMQQYADEVLNAIQQEPDVALADLDLAWYVQHGGDPALYRRLVEASRHRRRS